MFLIDRVREHAHRHCTTLITAQHDAVVQGAQAHHGTRQALAEARAETDRLEQELARAHERAEQAEAARSAAQEVLRQPLALAQDSYANALVASQMHHLMLLVSLTELAKSRERDGYTSTAAAVREMAELHHQRLSEAYEALSGPGHEAEFQARLERLIVEPLTLPTPREETAAAAGAVT